MVEHSVDGTAEKSVDLLVENSVARMAAYWAAPTVASSVAHLAEQRDLSWAVGLAEKSVANSAVHSVAHWAA